MDEPEEVLAGGNLSTVVRVGATVRRPAGPWTPDIHSLLRHVRARGLRVAPEPLGIDERGREILEYIDGSTAGAKRPWPTWAWSDALLVQAAAALRMYHEAVSDFRPRGSIRSRLGESQLGAGDIVCHNDFAPYNVVYRDGLVGVIDWDVVAAAPPVWDLAFFAWQWVPLHNEGLVRELGAPAIVDAPRRLSVLCETYGRITSESMIDVVLERVAASRRGILERAAEGDPAFIRLRDAGHPAAMLATIEWIHMHETELRSATT